MTDSINSDIFEIMVVGYGLYAIKLFETCNENQASDCCLKNNLKLLTSGWPKAVLNLHPQYQYYRKKDKTKLIKEKGDV